MKTKENGLIDYGVIELKEEDGVLKESPELELAKQVYCSSWPFVLVYLQYLIDKIKNPFFRMALNIGLSLIDGLHDQFCKPKES